VTGSTNVFKLALAQDRFKLGDSESERQGWQQLAPDYAMPSGIAADTGSIPAKMGSGTHSGSSVWLVCFSQRFGTSLATRPSCVTPEA